MLTNILNTTLVFNTTQIREHGVFKDSEIEYQKTQPQKSKETKRSTYYEIKENRTEYTHTDNYATHNNSNPHQDTHVNNTNRHTDSNPHYDNHTDRGSHSNYNTNGTQHSNYGYHVDDMRRDSRREHVDGHQNRWRSATQYPDRHVNQHFDTRQHDYSHTDTVRHANSGRGHTDENRGTTSHTDNDGHSNYGSSYYDHTNRYRHTDTGSTGNKHTNTYKHNQYNTPHHVNNYQHIDSGFNHTNYIPSKPEIGVWTEDKSGQKTVVRKDIKIGLASYDKDGDPIKYDVRIRRKGSPTWITVLTNSTSERATFNLDENQHAEGIWEVEAVAHNSMSGNGVTTVYRSPVQIKEIEVKYNEEPMITVEKPDELIEFTFGGAGKGVLTDKGTYKNYRDGIYTATPSGVTSTSEGILLRVGMRDPDIGQYQTGEIELLDSSNKLIIKESITWSNGSTKIQSNNINVNGHIFIPVSKLKGKEEPAKFRVRVHDYEDSGLTKLVSDTTVLTTISKTDRTPLDINLDFVAPSISITYASGITQSTKDTTANVKVTDGLSGVEKVEYQWVESSVVAPDETKWLTHISGAVNSPKGLNGNYKLIVRAQDKVRNDKTLIGGVVKFDNTKPDIVITTDGNLTYKQSHTTLVGVTDKSELVYTKYMWTNSEVMPTSGTWKDFIPGETLVTPEGVTGDYYLHVKAADIGGNTEEATSKVFKVDNTIPVANIESNGSTMYEKTHKTIVRVNDIHAGVETSQYQWTRSSVTPTSGKWTKFNYADEISYGPDKGLTGDYYLHINVVDKAGNEMNTVSNVFKFDNTTPYVTSIEGKPEVLTVPPHTMTIKADDDHSKVKSIRLASITYKGKPVDPSLYDREWHAGSTYRIGLIYNGDYEFELMDNAGNIATSADDPKLHVLIDKMNYEVTIDSFKVDDKQVKTTINYDGKNAHVIKRKEYYSTFLAEVTDKNLDDILTYNIEITGLRSPDPKDKVIPRTGETEKTIDNVWLIDSDDMTNWPDGMYKAKYTVTDSILSFGNLSTASEELYFFILREKPPVPIITIDNRTEKATVVFPEHPILTVARGLDKELTREVAIGGGEYKEYTGEIDLTGVDKDTTIYARYTDLNDNSSIAIKTYAKNEIPAKPPEGGVVDSPINVEENRSSTNMFINIRNIRDEGELRKGTFDFLKNN